VGHRIWSPRRILPLCQKKVKAKQCLIKDMHANTSSKALMLRERTDPRQRPQAPPTCTDWAAIFISRRARLPILLVRTSGLASAWISSAPPSSTSASATAYSSRPGSTGRPSIRAWTPSALDMHASLRPMMNTFGQQDGALERRCLPWIRSRHARNSISSSYDSVVAAIYRIVLVTTWLTGNTANVTITTRLHVSTTPGGDFGAAAHHGGHP